MLIGFDMVTGNDRDSVLMHFKFLSAFYCQELFKITLKHAVGPGLLLKM